MSGVVDRRVFRVHALDGAALYFQPATGVHVRIAHASTRHLRRRAPRVAMFGITNACNLTCGFCSRDVDVASGWTVATAAAALRGLHDAGTLEVAYGGGEPFAFRGFAELVAELDATTTLAQHVTTNGTLIRAAMWPRFAGRFGQVRISIYDGVPWRDAADVLVAHGQRWGANVLVDAAALDGLPALLAALAATGCHDVSLLSYVGPDAHRHLDAAGARRLAAIIADSPVGCRLSVCFGDRVPSPRLLGLDGDGDCGAGRDFISITPDQRVQSCSFQDRGVAATTAAEILAVWRLRQPQLAAPSPRRGCARTLARAIDPPPPPPIAIWQAFSGNNSGECVLVATFHAIADAEAYLAALVPGWTAGAEEHDVYPAAWRQLFADEAVAAVRLDADAPYGVAPRELVAIGRTVIALQGAPDDAFPELRALAWKRGAAVAPGGIHVHDPLTLVVAIRTRDDADRAALAAAARTFTAPLHVHGADVLLAIPIGAFDDLAAARDQLLRFSDGRPLAVAVAYELVADDALIAAMQRLGHRPPGTPRLWLSFWTYQRDDATAIAFAQALPGERVTVAATSVLIDPAPDRKRLAVLAYRRGGEVTALDGTRIELHAHLWYDTPPQQGKRAEPRTFDLAALEATLRAAIAPGSQLAIVAPDPAGYRPGPAVTITTDAPAIAMTALASYARTAGAELSIGASDLDPLGATLRRLVADLD